MPHGLWGWTTWLVVLGFPLAWSRRPRWRDLAAMLLVVNLIAVGLLILLEPERRTPAGAGGLLLLDLGAAALIRRREPRLRAVLRTRPALAGLALGVTLIVPPAGIELVSRVLSDRGWVRYHRPLETVWRGSGDDWRRAMITGDENREPDPVLLWRPVDHKPFSSQRFKSPLVKVPKPPGVLRVMCYGDSLTDGPPRDGWPAWLERALALRAGERRVEVMNAGVVGYSSHQGLLRFLQEVDVYSPDVLVVSFGWNDVAQAADVPDREFHIPPWPLVALERRLVRYRSYLVLMEYVRKLRPQPAPRPNEPRRPRVSVDDYLANLERFRAEAARRKIPIVFVTRPHKLDPRALAQSPGWRADVPGYNDALRKWADANHLPLVDAQAHFERLSPDLFSDECHFVPAGYQEMGKLIADVLTARPGLLAEPALTAGKAGETRK